MIDAAGNTSPPIRLCLLPDFPEEDWLSMDLCAEMLEASIRRRGDVAIERFAPTYVRRFGGRGRNVDRLLNRFREYPRLLRRARLNDKFDAFHLVDHSYAQLVHALPARRAGAYCHDLDTFRCIIEPDRDPLRQNLAILPVVGALGARIGLHPSVKEKDHGPDFDHRVRAEP